MPGPQGEHTEPLPDSVYHENRRRPAGEPR